MMYYNPNVKATFRALVDAIIPYTPRLAYEQGAIQAEGGLYAHVDEYLIWSLDHFFFNVPLASPTAELLDIAAFQLISMGAPRENLSLMVFPYSGAFTALSQEDRLKAVTLLEQLQIDLGSLPFPYQNNVIFVQIIVEFLNRFTVFGYYAAWSEYGAAGLTLSENHKLENIPVSWQQVRYPGRAYIYHAFRGYLVDKFTE